MTDAIVKDLQDVDGWKTYVAGTPPMVEAAMQIVTERGLRPANLHADVFFTSGEASARHTSLVLRVVVDQSLEGENDEYR